MRTENRILRKKIEKETDYFNVKTKSRKLALFYVDDMYFKNFFLPGHDMHMPFECLFN